MTCPQLRPVFILLMNTIIQSCLSSRCRVKLYNSVLRLNAMVTGLEFLYFITVTWQWHSMFKSKRFRIVFLSLFLVLVGAGIAATVILRPYFEVPERLNVLTVGGGASGASTGPPELMVMDFSTPISLDPVPAGWRHRRFLTRAPMDISFTEKNARPAIRLATDNSASMLFRHVDVDLRQYPVLAWQWLVEKPIDSPVDERTREGDDHPARLFISFRTEAGERRAMEIIWGNQLRRGEYKYIGGFPHYVANGGAENVGTWQDEEINLLAIYRKIWEEETPATITDIAIFCDSDETNSSSVAYFASVSLKQQ